MREFDKIKDIYKLEKGGIYFIRLDPTLVTEKDWCLFEQIVCPQLREEENITIVPFLLKKDALEFIPKPKKGE